MKKKNNIGKKIAIGAGVVAVGTAAYMLLGPDGKKNRKKIQDFTKGVSKKVAKNKDVKKITQEFKKMVNSAKSVTKKVAKKVETQAVKVQKAVRLPSKKVAKKKAK